MVCVPYLAAAGCLAEQNYREGRGKDEWWSEACASSECRGCGSALRLHVNTLAAVTTVVGSGDPSEAAISGVPQAGQPETELVGRLC